MIKWVRLIHPFLVLLDSNEMSYDQMGRRLIHSFFILFVSYGMVWNMIKWVGLIHTFSVLLDGNDMEYDQMCLVDPSIYHALDSYGMEYVQIQMYRVDAFIFFNP